MRIKSRKGSWILFILCVFGIAFSSSAKAQSYTVSSVSDYFFSIQEPTEFVAKTFMHEGSPDTHLWLYGINNELLAANDDYYNLQSYLSYLILEPGIYRLRAGICCGDPDAWREGTYELETSLNSLYSSQETYVAIEEEETTTTVELTIPTIEKNTTTTSIINTTTTSIVKETVATTTPQIKTTTTISSTTIPTTIVQEPTTTTILNTTTTIFEENTKEVALNKILNSNMENITAEQAKEIFQNIDVNELTEEQKIELVLAVNQASDDVKKEFEKSVDVFGSGLDEYVPSGSNINVGARRAIIAVTTVLSTISVSMPTAGATTNRKQ